MLKKCGYYFQLMRFHKPIGILLLLWPTLWALWSASHGFPSLKNLFIFTFGVIVMRAAGCVINDIADRQFDLHVSRTQLRPITTGKISVKQAMYLFIFLCLLAFILVLQTNALTIILAFCAVITAITYPFMKRYTHWPQLILGIAYSFSIPMAFAATINTVPFIAIILMMANIAWTIAYDTEYAMTDRPEDVKIGIKSTAILFGQYDRWMIGLFQTIFIVLLISIGIVEKLSVIYCIAIICAVILLLYQQYLIAHRIPENCFRAFLNNQWVGIIIFASIFLQ